VLIELVVWSIIQSDTDLRACQLPAEVPLLIVRCRQHASLPAITNTHDRRIKPPYTLVGALMFYRLSFFLSFFFHHLLSELAERNSGSKRDLKKHSKIWHILSPNNRGPKTAFFDDFATCSGKFYGLHLRNDNRVSALQTARGFLHRLKTT